MGREIGGGENYIDVCSMLRRGTAAAGPEVGPIVHVGGSTLHYYC